MTPSSDQASVVRVGSERAPTKILIATDGSRNALDAVAFTAALFGEMHSTRRRITLLNVHDDIAFRHAERFVGRAVVAQYLHELSEADLAPARALLAAAGLAFDVEIRKSVV